jgi:hypothetical protein
MDAPDGLRERPSVKLAGSSGVDVGVEGVVLTGGEVATELGADALVPKGEKEVEEEWEEEKVNVENRGRRRGRLTYSCSFW